MDWSSLAGILLAFSGILFAQVVEGAHPGSLLQPTAFLIVFCGTLGAVLLQSRLPTFMRGMRMLQHVFRMPVENRQKLTRDALIWNMTARREGVLSLERYLRLIKDPFIAKGLRLVIDGVDAARIKEILEVDIASFEVFQRQAVRVWESAGGYSPTIGILGAVLGLIHVMENLSDPSKLGAGIAVAFVATIYGVALANLVFLPIAYKLKEQVGRDVEKMEMLADIFFSIAAGENSRVIEERVVSYE
ncbi:chemotaxis protein MotA [Oxalobacteraceae bacterium GrIS 2.11]